MNKKLLITAFALILLIPAFLPSVYAANEAKTVPNTDKLIYATIGEPETIDPAWAYDTSSAELIQNVYEPLISFPREKIPEDPQDFTPALASDWEITNGGATYTFYINTAGPNRLAGPTRRFHDGSVVLPSDVEYSYERGMVLDHVGGPQWMILYPLTGYYSTAEINLYNQAQVNALGLLIANSVTSNNAAGTVTFNLQFAYAPFTQIVTQSWGMIYKQSWVTGLGRLDDIDNAIPIWDGTWGVRTTYNNGTATGYTLANTEWANHNDNIIGMAASPLQTDNTGNFAPVEMGTGPYELVTWQIENYYELARFPGYWQGWPAPGAVSYVSSVIHLLAPSWTPRKLLFLSNNPNSHADMVDVPRQNMADVVNEEGVRHTKNLPTLILSPAGYFNFEIATTSVYFGVKPTLAGVTKLDLYSDENLRKAFAHSLNYAQYNIDVYQGEAELASSALIRGMTFWNGSKPSYNYDLNLAKWHFMMAYGGSDADGNPNTLGDVTPGTLWNLGFTSPLTYNTGNVARQTLMNMLKTAIQTQITGWGVIPTLDPTPLPWGTVYIPAKNNYELPYFAIGWVSDFADPDNNVFTFWHEYGDSSRFQSIDWTQIDPEDFAPSSGRKQSATTWRGVDTSGNPITVSGITDAQVDALVEAGAANSNPAIRGPIYEYLVDLWYAEMPTMTPSQALGRHWERDWVQGYFYNLIGSGSIGFFYYYMWKGLDADVTNDGTVDPDEIAALNLAWHDPPFYNGNYNVEDDISFAGRTDKNTREMDGNNYLLEGADAKVNLEDLGLVKLQALDTLVPNNP